MDERFVFLSLPGFSLLLLGGGALGLVLPGVGSALPTPWGQLLAVLAGLVAAGGLVLSVIGLFGPKPPTWILPGWARD